MGRSDDGFPRIANWGIVLLATLSLVTCLFYAYTISYLAPYPGITIGPDLSVQAIEPCEDSPAWCQSNQGLLHVGDQLLVIGDRTYIEFQRDRSLVPFGGYRPGDEVPVVFRREGRELTASWRMVGPTAALRGHRLIEINIDFCPVLAGGDHTSAIFASARPTLALADSIQLCHRDVGSSGAPFEFKGGLCFSGTTCLGLDIGFPCASSSPQRPKPAAPQSPTPCSENSIYRHCYPGGSGTLPVAAECGLQPRDLVRCLRKSSHVNCSAID